MADTGDALSPEALDALLSGTEEESRQAQASPAQAGSESQKGQAGMGLDQASLDALVGSLGQGPGKEAESGSAQTATLDDLSSLSASTEEAAKKGDNTDLLKDVTLRFTVELGRTEMLIKDVLQLGEGSIVELNKDVGAEVELYANEHFFGRGRLKIIGDYFCVQITSIEDPLSQYRIDNP